LNTFEVGCGHCQVNLC